jgi:hypothetical protein
MSRHTPSLSTTATVSKGDRRAAIPAVADLHTAFMSTARLRATPDVGTFAEHVRLKT